MERVLPDSGERMQLRPDPFLLAMIAVMGLAAAFPASGSVANSVDRVSTLAIANLFFSHGAALAPAAVAEGLRHWRLHLFVFAVTFVAFPLLIYPLTLIRSELFPPDLILGFLYLAVLPSAVSSSIAFTAMARGNVPAAVCSSAASNVFGLMLTPLLFVLLTGSPSDGGIDPLGSLKSIGLELLLPFIPGQLMRPMLAGLAARHHASLKCYDQAVILLVIYGAISHSVRQGSWTTLGPATVALLIALCFLLLAAVLSAVVVCARRLGFSREDEIAAAFCGSKKSLASGLPLAQILFAGTPTIGLIVLPIIVYNQVQILVGAVLAQRYRDRYDPVL